jgi:lipoprotein-releasing system ATP-binding protein
LLGLLDAPTSGRVLLDGENTSTLHDAALARLRLLKIGFVFQFHFLLPEFSVIENVTVPMRKLGALSERAAYARAETLLIEVSLADHMRKRVDQLSAGERQRVAIARALANDPLVVLADEPTGNLDTKSGRLVFDIFARLTAQRSKTVVMVTHDLGLAALCNRRIQVVDGSIVSDECGS